MGLRTIAVVALAAALGWLVFRAVLTRRVPWISLGLVLLLLVPLFVTERQWISTEHKLAAVSRSEAGNVLGIHCQRLGESLTYAGSDLGHVQFDADGFPTGPAVLSYDTCRGLAAYLGMSASERQDPPEDVLVAVHVLSHETAHLTGIVSESEAECWAVQYDAHRRAARRDAAAGARPGRALLARGVSADARGLPHGRVRPEHAPGPHQERRRLALTRSSAGGGSRRA
ncbi:MAG: hypothetical protein U0R76_06690 [Candidatus Nanopelagicales bacterium]